MPEYAFRNAILRQIDPAARERLGLRHIALPRSEVLEEPNEPIKHLYFVEAGLASMTTVFMNGAQVEIGMFGPDGVIGLPALLTGAASMNATQMQVSGEAFTAPVANAVREFERGELFQKLILSCAHIQLLQSAQSAACNARHSLERRLSRWLLVCHDRVVADTMDLTQEFLAIMLGVTRPTLSETAAKLQRRGLIEYKRGLLRICNRPALERNACECYSAVQGYLREQHLVEPEPAAPPVTKPGRQPVH